MRLPELLSQISNGAGQIILIIIGLVIVVIFLSRKTWENIVGICSLAIGQGARKWKNKEKIFTLLRDKGELSNSDIRETLGISDRSVIRYMDELELEGRVNKLATPAEA